MAKRRRPNSAAKLAPTRRGTPRPTASARPRKGGLEQAASQPGEAAPEGAAAKITLIRLLKEVEKLSSQFHADFLKCQRGQDRLSPRVRSRIRNLVDSYTKKVDSLRQRFGALPQDTALEIPGLGGLRSVAEKIRACLDRMYLALIEQQAAIAAPMDSRQQREFWENIRKLADEMRALLAFAKGVRAWIDREKKGSEDPRLAGLEQAFKHLCEAITEFFCSFTPSQSTTNTASLQQLQAAVTRYEKHLQYVHGTIKNQLPAPEGPTPPARRHPDPVTVGTRPEELREMLGYQVLLINALCQQDALRFGLPLMAERQALEIQELVNPALLENRLLVATIGAHMGDTKEQPDAVDEGRLPDYPTLSALPKESEQFRLLVDSGLLLHHARGPDATFDRKELRKSVALLATTRGMPILGATSVWAKLNRLVDLQIFLKLPARKTRANPNASDEYRLTFAAQSKYSAHTAAVRAETSPRSSPAAASAEL